MTPRQRLNLLNRFDAIAQEFAFKGSFHPNDAASVTLEYNRLKRLLAKELGTSIPDEEPDDEEFT